MALARWKALCMDATEPARLAASDSGLPWTVMADPQGNEFCVVAPG